MLATLGLILGAFTLLGPGQPSQVKPLVRILAGGGMQAAPTELVAAIYSDGRVERPRASFRTTHSEVLSLVGRLKMIGLYSLTQRKLDGAVNRSTLPPASMRPGSGLCGIEFEEKGKTRRIQLRTPEHYRGQGLREVDVFLAAYAEVKRFKPIARSK